MKTVVITGGSDGLGKSLATEFVSDHNVIIISPTQSKLEQVAQDIGCSYIVADVSNWDSISVAMDKVINDFSRIDVLINNAGLWIEGELADNDPSRITEVLDVNVKGVMYSSKAVIPYMKQKKEGMIININSQGGLYAKAERAVYNATKWAITGFSKSLQPELSQYNIRVTDVHPGKMKTDMFSKMNIEKDMSNAIDTKKVARLVRFIIKSDSDVVIPEVGIKDILN